MNCFADILTQLKQTENSTVRCIHKDLQKIRPDPIGFSRIISIELDERNLFRLKVVMEAPPFSDFSDEILTFVIQFNEKFPVR